jgi:hypothetical protein
MLAAKEHEHPSFPETINILSIWNHTNLTYQLPQTVITTHFR